MRVTRGQLLSVAFALIGLILFSFLSKVSVEAQAGCATPPLLVDAQLSSWAQGVNVRVNISPSFSAAERAAIEEAFGNWQNANGPSGNGSGVTFTFASSPTPISGTNTSQVNKATPSLGGQAETGGNHNGTNRISANTNIDPRVTNTTALAQVMAHEIGHMFGLADCTSCTAGQSAMKLPTCPPCDFNDTVSGLTGPSDCDIQKSREAGQYQSGEDCETDGDLDGWDSCIDCDDTDPDFTDNCEPGGDPEACVGIECQYSPILVDTSGDGFDLTDASGGVSFDVQPNGIPEHVAWTRPNSDDAWLVLDRNGNGVIDNGLELFGNFSSQAPSETPNGFRALAEFDKQARGGNSDTFIDSRDSVFELLRLWLDANHNGISEQFELHPLPSLNVKWIALEYKEKKRRDFYGNQFRYRAKVGDTHGSSVGRWAWDVFLTSSR